MLVKLSSGGILTIPEEIREGLDENSLLDVIRREDGVIELHRKGKIDPSQARFWTERWQRMEREADEDFAAGRVRQFDNVEDFIAALDGIDEGNVRRNKLGR